jgi:hypothetical protein
MMNLLGYSKWPSILGLIHGRCINIVVKDILILNIDPLSLIGLQMKGRAQKSSIVNSTRQDPSPVE